MSPITTGPAQYGDTENTLLLKIATAYWGQLLDTSGLSEPHYGDSRNMLLFKIAKYLFRL